MAVGEGIVVGEISSLLRRIGSFKDTVEHRIGQALVIDRLLDHHTSPAEGPVRRQFGAKAQLFRQAAKHPARINSGQDVFVRPAPGTGPSAGDV